MPTTFADRPGLSTFVNVAILVFIGLSVINLYYSIKVNKSILNKAAEK
jgi:hypothetical protein